MVVGEFGSCGEGGVGDAGLRVGDGSDAARRGDVVVAGSAGHRVFWSARGFLGGEAVGE